MSIQITDVVAATMTVIAAVALAPLYTDFLRQWGQAAGGLTALLTGLVLPMIFIGILLSIGISARRGA